jgi:putative Mg2+ transporter-C (MgtC) family protein
MVSLGSCLFVGIEIIATLQLSFFAGLNPLQLAGSVIIGIGFIGAGLSSLRGEHPELTTASGIWVAAGIGMACGFGFYTLAVATALLGLVIFSVIAKLEHNISTRFGTKHEE